MEALIREKLDKTLKALTPETGEAVRQELALLVESAQLHEDGRVQVVGTLESFLEPVFVQSGAENGI